MNTKRQRYVVLAIALLSVAVLWIVLWAAGDVGGTDFGGPTGVPPATADESVVPAEAPAGREEERAPVLDLKLEIDTLSRLEADGGSPSALLLDLGLEEVGARIELRDARGEPVPDGSVRFIAGPSARSLFHANPQGVVEVAGVVAARHLVEISGPTTFQRFLRLDREDERDLVVRWGPTATVYGSICDEANRSLAGVEVTGSGRTVTTDAEGNYRIEGLFAGDGTPLRAIAPGFVTSEVAVDLRGGVPLKYHFVMQGAGSVAGRVLVPPQDVAEARLYLLPVATGRSSRELAFPFHLRGVYAEAPVNADGTFELGGLPVPATMQVVVRHPRYTMTPVPLSVRSTGVQTEKLILAPVRAPLVSGRIRSAVGRRPIAGATVECRPERSGGRRAGLVPFPPMTLVLHVIPLEIVDLEWTETRSDEYGSYSLPRRQGAHDTMILTAVAESYSPASVRIAGGSTFRRNLELVPLAGDGEGSGAATLRLSFTTSESPRALLRITLFREGRQEATPFLWESARPYEVRFPAPSRIRLAGAFQEERRLLSRFDTEVIVRGEVTCPVTVPPR